MLRWQCQGLPGQFIQRRQAQLRLAHDEHPALATNGMGEVEKLATFRGLAQGRAHVSLPALEQFQALGNRRGWRVDKPQPGHLRDGRQHITVKANPGPLARAEQVRRVLAADYAHARVVGDPLALGHAQFNPVMCHVRA
ncbi:hypothetical protein D3C77_636990 [compost metagenome]